MVGDQRLGIEQRQSLSMTQELQQSIKLLQLSALELRDYVSDQVEQNPLLEFSEVEVVPVEKVDIPDDTKSGSQDVVEHSRREDLSQEQFGDNYDNVWDADATVSSAVYDTDVVGRHYTVGSGGGYAAGEGDRSFADQVTEDRTLREHVLDQIYVDIQDPKERFIALYLSDMLDDNGYISSDLGPLSERIKCDIRHIEPVLERLQSFEPAGVFARSLSECLALQLQDKNHLDPVVTVLLEHLDLVAAGDLAALQRVCDADVDDIQHMVEEIKSLNPKPGLLFQSEVVQVIEPDVFLKRHPGGHWLVELNSDVLPKVLVNKRYYKDITSQALGKDDKQYVVDQFQSANWLVRALDQRARTMLKVVSELVERQSKFFSDGIQYLKPLTLSDIADVVEVHESTVSRVTQCKYLATPLGVFELKYFFSSGVHSVSGDEAVSSRSVKFMIQDLITHEDGAKPFSDEKLVYLLREKGVDVARRTVAKYREALGIASSSKRKKANKGL